MLRSWSSLTVQHHKKFTGKSGAREESGQWVLSEATRWFHTQGTFLWIKRREWGRRAVGMATNTSTCHSLRKYRDYKPGLKLLFQCVALTLCCDSQFHAHLAGNTRRVPYWQAWKIILRYLFSPHHHCTRDPQAKNHVQPKNKLTIINSTLQHFWLHFQVLQQLSFSAHCCDTRQCCYSSFKAGIVKCSAQIWWI